MTDTHNLLDYLKKITSVSECSISLFVWQGWLPKHFTCQRSQRLLSSDCSNTLSDLILEATKTPPQAVPPSRLRFAHKKRDPTAADDPQRRRLERRRRCGEAEIQEDPLSSRLCREVSHPMLMDFMSLLCCCCCFKVSSRLLEGLSSKPFSFAKKK